MPLTSLTAVSDVTSPGGFNDWVRAGTGGGGKAGALNSDDAGAGSRINENQTNKNQLLEWTNLPTAARGGEIKDLEFESCSRRGGGCVSGQWHHFTRDPVSTNTFQGITRVPGAFSPCARFFESLPVDQNGNVWTQPQVDLSQYGARSGVVICTGMNVYFMTINVTWAAAGGAFEVHAISWLGPLILAGLRGLNLFSESAEQLVSFERNVFRLIYRKAGIQTYPALMLPEEREKVLWELFKQPVYAF